MADLEPLITPRAGVQFSDLPATAQVQLVPRLLAGKHILWIWDNIETLNSLSASTQQELTTLMRESAAAGIRILLTSRSAEQNLLGYLPVRIEAPPLRFSDSLDFANALTRRMGNRAVHRNDLVEILAYCEGNPLTLAVALASLLDRHPTPTAQQAHRFVDELRSGEANLEDEVNHHSHSLTASLHLGLAALNHSTLKRVALLYLFRRYANVNILLLMLRPVRDGGPLVNYEWGWTLPGFVQETLPSLDRALRRSADVGLLRRPKAQHYWLHPALHLHLKHYFGRFYPRRQGYERAARAFAESLGFLREHLPGSSPVI